MKHSTLSPSAAHRWILCPGARALESAHPDTRSPAATRGTASHLLAAAAWGSPAPASKQVGVGLVVDGDMVIVDQAMADDAQTYIEGLRSYAGRDSVVMIEQRLDLSETLGVPDTFGTADAIVIRDDEVEIQIHDAKFGRGVRVDANHNWQLILYALGALHAFDPSNRVQRVRLVIHQPPLNHRSEWLISTDELRQFGALARVAAKRAVNCFNTLDPKSDLVPGETQCRFCRAKANCPALSKYVLETVAQEFSVLDDSLQDRITQSTKSIATVDLNRLSIFMRSVELIEGFCREVRNRTERELKNGSLVPGFTLGMGRRGTRKWSDPLAAQAALEHAGLSHAQIFDYELISPPAAERLVKAGAIAAPDWTAMRALINQSPGSPTVTLVSSQHPRVEPSVTLNDFDKETAMT